jgi:hypothetical protein
MNDHNAHLVYPRAAASIRTAVRLPVRLADGREALGTIYSFNGLADDKEHIVLTGDVFASARCDCEVYRPPSDMAAWTASGH